MSDWDRSTRECTIESLPEDIRGAIQGHAEQYNLGDILSKVTACIETTSTRNKKGFFSGGGRNVQTAAVLTPVWLIWAVRGERPEVAVLSARLADIVVQDYAATEFAKLIPDTGVEVSGSFTDVSERGSAFIGLDDSPAAKRFRDELIEGVQAAKNK